MQKILKKSLKIFKEILFYLFIGIMLIGASTNFLGKLNGERPQILGYSTLIVISGSMEPTYKINEFLIMKKVDYEKIVVGDVVTFNYDIDLDGFDDLVTHRVIEIKPNGELVLRGDSQAAQYQTQTITKDKYVGKIVFNCYLLGAALYVLIRYNIFIILMGGFFVYLIVKQIKKISKLYAEEKRKELEEKNK